jgi:flagellar protein FliO/FliZ
MDALFGSAMPLAARFFIAFLVVLALIGLTAWLVRRFGANRLGGSTRGRQPRLAVIDAASVDGRRRLVLIRRDNVEHLLMIGGPTDVVIEPNIVRAAAAGVREPPRLATTPEPARPATPEPAVRVTPPLESTWPPPPSEPAAPPPPPARPYRPTATEEPWHAPEPGARARPADSLTGLAAELSSKLAMTTTAEPAPPPLPPREREPQVPRTTAAPPMAPVAPVAPEPPPTVAPQPDHNHNLAEMAQQLEAALRRAPAPESRPPVTDALAVPPKVPRPAARENKPRVEPKFEPPKYEPPKSEQPKFEPPKFEPAKYELAKRELKIEAPKFEAHKFEAPKFEPPKPEPVVVESRPEPKFELRPEPKFEPKLEPMEPKVEAKAEAPTTHEKKLYDSLEEEMASLLGRPPDKS